MNYNKIKEILNKHNITGASISSIQSSKVGNRMHFGFKSLENSCLIDDQTVFEVGSISKPLFSMAVVSFMKNNSISLDYPLVQLYPYSYSNWEIDYSEENFRKITTSMILSHTSGFNNWDNWDDAPLRKLKFTPGRSFSYSGEGYIYLQKVFEHLSQKNLQEYFEHDLYSKLGLKNSSFIWNPEIGKKLATGYGIRNHGVGSEWSEAFSAFSLYSTIEDLEQFICGIINGLKENNSIYNELLCPRVWLTKTCSWGLGWGIEHPSQTFWHWGNLGNFQCFIAGSQIYQDGIVILTNSGNAKSAFYDLIIQTMGREIKCSQQVFLEKIENHNFLE